MPRLPDELWSRAERFLPDKISPADPQCRSAPALARRAPLLVPQRRPAACWSMPRPARARAIAEPEAAASRGRARVARRQARDLRARHTISGCAKSRRGAERPLTEDGAPWHAYGKSADMNLTTHHAGAARHRPAARRRCGRPTAAHPHLSARRARGRRFRRWCSTCPEDGSARPLVLASCKLALSGDANLPMLDHHGDRRRDRARSRRCRAAR